MPQRMDAGNGDLNRAASGCAIVSIGAIVLIASLFMDRADDYFYEVADNQLIGYPVVGPLILALLVASLGLMGMTLKRRGSSLGPALLVLVSLALLALSIVASQDLGTHQAYEGYLDNEPSAGTVFSIVGSGLMIIGSLLALWGSARTTDRPGDQPL